MRLHPATPRARVFPALREDNIVGGKLGERLSWGIDEIITFSVWLVRNPHRG